MTPQAIPPGLASEDVSLFIWADKHWIHHPAQYAGRQDYYVLRTYSFISTDILSGHPVRFFLSRFKLTKEDFPTYFLINEVPSNNAKGRYIGIVFRTITVYFGTCINL